MKIAVCDDEAAVRRETASLIAAQYPDAQVAEFASAGELLASRESFSVTVLDVELGGLSGMELARLLRRDEEESGGPRSVIVFVTAYREYMEEAFDVNAFHYLVKPVSPARLRAVLDRALREASSLAESAGRHILVKSGGVSRALPLKDILFIESSNKRAVFHTPQGALEVYIKMDALEQTLGPSFYRCHRCCLVNLEKVAAYSADAIELVSGVRLPLSKKKYPGFVRAFLRHAVEGGVVNVR